MKKLSTKLLLLLTILYPHQSLSQDAHGHNHDHAKEYEKTVQEIKQFESSPDFKPEILSTSLPEDIIYGDASTPIRIVEYASLSCGACKAFYQSTFSKIKEKFIDTKKAHLVYRHFPLNNNALKAATIVSCSKKEDRQKLTSKLFTMQESWAFIQFDLEVKNKLKSLSSEFVDGAAFDKCYNDEALQDNILKDMKNASEGLFIKSTPSIFVNGKRFVGAGEDALLKYIEELSNKK
jgi:protein-disulfide isomerase